MIWRKESFLGLSGSKSEHVLEPCVLDFIFKICLCCGLILVLRAELSTPTQPYSVSSPVDARLVGEPVPRVGSDRALRWHRETVTLPLFPWNTESLFLAQDRVTALWCQEGSSVSQPPLEIALVNSPRLGSPSAVRPQKQLIFMM